MADETTTPATPSSTPKANGKTREQELAAEWKAAEDEIKGFGTRVHDLSVKAQQLLQWPKS